MILVLHSDYWFLTNILTFHQSPSAKEKKNSLEIGVCVLKDELIESKTKTPLHLDTATANEPLAKIRNKVVQKFDLKKKKIVFLRFFPIALKVFAHF